MLNVLMDRIRKADRLPSLPSVALEVLRLTRNDDVSVEQLSRVIQNDPALCAKLLKIVNSSLFGVPREISSVRQATVILGLRSVKVMALSFSVVDVLRVRERDEFDMEGYWRRSLSTAVAARLIGKEVAPPMAEEAFVAGLLADIGAFAAWCCAPQEYQPVYRAALERRQPLWQAERDRLGGSHAAMSAELLRAWNLPEGICRAVASHHGEDLDTIPPGSSTVARVVHAGALVAEMFCGDAPASGLEPIRERCLVLTGISAAGLEGVFSRLDKYVRETAVLLSVPVGETISYERLQSEAAAQLAELSVQAEVERASAVRSADVAQAEASRLEREKREILEVASTDGLTSLANRAAFDKRLEEELSRSRATGAALSLILMDVDHFKRFNDTHGHQAGDAVLQAVAEAVRGVANPDGLVARYGGEEFAVIVLRKAGEELRALAEKIRSTIEARTVCHEGKTLRVTASLGVATVPPGKHDTDPREIIRLADERLYAAKRAGRNRVVAG